MDETTELLALIGAATLGILATLAILRRERSAAQLASRAATSPFAVSSEGMKRCPSCGVANLVTDDRCSGCGWHLADAH
jgi:hypothetical protein